MKFFIRLYLILGLLFITFIFLYLLATIVFDNALKLERDNVLPHQIAIVMVIEESTLSRYTQAIKTIWCYSLQYNYTYVILNDLRYPDSNVNCKQTDFYFLRHCLLYNFALQVKDDIKYIVFVDGDIGVVNPLHRIEKYLPKNEEEIFFYDRTFNYEIMAGSYIVRNNFYGRMFINSFANYEFKVPKENDGTDNVALQAVVLDFLNPISHPSKYRKCLAFYKLAKGFDLNMAFVSCMRHILELIDETPSDPDYHTYDKGRFKILRKLSSQRWARDTWLTGWLFCDNDFMLHGWKTEEIFSNSKIFIGEFNPTENLCKSSNFLKAWNYNLSAKVSNEEINDSVMEWVASAYNSHLNDLNKTGILDVE